ncbi:glucosaminidase domain-containing protein [Marinobacter sediminum]|uniref:glucosaminidase domain-containing protein n=1 Tax=Marinobacter sediminum TaxID=256323 RepID=UPI00202DB6A8|nr:glucosaminidase domain-containing protein [Marinobacter sediminum]MCM0612665.1 glucosaminidase domain-containing protein [Marinobacter sediminum]
MSSGKRALLLIVPLIAFAVGGGFYVPPGSMTGGAGGEPALSSLPSLPNWADDDLPDFSQFRDTTEKKAAFFSFLYPRIVLANSRILIERDYLDSLANQSSLAEKEKKWLTAQANRLRIDEKIGSPEFFDLLHKRLDIIPPSLILAQSANESAWGTSRFATRGNNLFGQWCFSKGCGLVPRSRVEGADHEVAKFSSPYRSVRAYIQNLNSHPTYQSLRDIRLKDRRAGDPLSGLDLARGLLGYSERGQDYIEEIRAMIHYNNLEFYDDDFRSVIKDLSPSLLEQLASADREATLLPGQSSSTPPAEG